MATQNIIQYLETTQYYADQRDGSTVAVGPAAMNRRQVETYIASEAIAVGEAVSLDMSKTAAGDVMIHAVVADNATAAAEGETLDVCIAGVCEGLLAAGVAAGDRLRLDTAGAVDAYANSDVFPIVAYAVDANGTASPANGTVVVIKQM
jgi:hypothetical protein